MAIPVNPFADLIEGDVCYKSIAAIPNKPDAVFIVTRNDASMEVVKQCIETGC